MDEEIAKRDAEPLPELLLGIRLIPHFGEPLAQYVIERHHRGLQRAAEVLRTASDESGLDPVELLKKASEHEELSDFLGEALAIGSRSRLDEKRRALGKVVAQALGGDDARIDDYELTIRALGGIEAAHVRVMALMYLGGELRTERITVAGAQVTHPELSTTVEAVLLQLLGWGLVKTERPRFLSGRDIGPQYARPQDIERPDEYSLTTLGVSLMELLRADIDPGVSNY